MNFIKHGDKLINLDLVTDITKNKPLESGEPTYEIVFGYQFSFRDDYATDIFTFKNSTARDKYFDKLVSHVLVL